MFLFRSKNAFVFLILAWLFVFSPYPAPAQEGDPNQPPAPGVEQAEQSDSSSAETELYIGDVASRSQMLMLLILTLLFLIYTSVRFNVINREIKRLDRMFCELDDDVEGGRYERLDWNGVFHTVEEDSPILPRLSFGYSDCLLLGCQGGEAVPNLRELKSDERINLLLNIVYNALQRPEQNVIVVSRRLDIAQIGWGLLSLAAQCDFNALTDVQKAEMLERENLKGWEKALYCFNSWSIGLNTLYNTCLKLRKKGEEVTVVFDGLEALSENGRDDADFSGLYQSLSSFARKSHVGLAVLLDQKSPWWLKRAEGNISWVELSFSGQNNSEVKAEGSWSGKHGNPEAISEKWEVQAGSGMLK